MMGKPKIRFKGYNEDWEQRKLGEVFEFQYGEFNNNPDNGGEYPIYGANGIIGGYTDWNAENSSIIGHMGAYAGYVVWGEGKHFVTYNGTIARPKDNSIDSKYGYYLLDSKKIYKICAGSGQPFVSYSDLNGIDILLPKDKDEQRLLAYYFTNLDHLITLHHRECVILQKTKVNDWEQRKLNEVAEFNPKSDLPESFEYVDLESVVGTEMVSHRTETKETAPSRAQRLAQTGDVFFQTVRPYQRNNYLFTKPDNNYVFSTGYAHMRPKIDAEFLMCFLQTDSFVKVVLDNCTGTSYPAINSNDLSNLEIDLPTSEDEQRRIGCFITNLDHLITLHQHKCDELQNLKKYMLQNMFV